MVVALTTRKHRRLSTFLVTLASLLKILPSLQMLNHGGRSFLLSAIVAPNRLSGLHGTVCNLMSCSHISSLDGCSMHPTDAYNSYDVPRSPWASAEAECVGCKCSEFSAYFSERKFAFKRVPPSKRRNKTGNKPPCSAKTR